MFSSVNAFFAAVLKVKKYKSLQSGCNILSNNQTLMVDIRLIEKLTFEYPFVAAMVIVTELMIKGLRLIFTAPNLVGCYRKPVFNDSLPVL